MRWSGPALALAGAAALAAMLLRPGAEASPLAWWISNSALRPDRVLPLIGVGAALALVRPLACGAAAAALVIGLALGFAFYAPMLDPLWVFPRAAESNFLTGPAAALAAGLALIVPRRMRDWLVVPSALLAGTASALAIVVTDPSIGGAGNRIAGVLIALWIVAAACLGARGFYRPWFDAAGRILGSWLIAIALLYGTAALMPLRERPAALSVSQGSKLDEVLAPNSGSSQKA